jgi:hypothetical protein
VWERAVARKVRDSYGSLSLSLSHGIGIKVQLVMGIVKEDIDTFVFLHTEV